MRRVRRLVLSGAAGLALGLPASQPARAQDTHYWTQQYGDRAQLLGGAVVGSAVDLSAVYYNPGALSLLESPDLVVATKVFEWTQLSARGDGDLDLKLGDNRLGLAPGFFAGLLPFGFLESDVLSYSVFTRFSFDGTLRALGTGHGDVFPTLVGPEDFYGSIDLSGKLSETWVGLTWSRALGNIGVGVSQFVAARSQRGGQSVMVQAFAPGELEAISIGERTYSYYHYRLLWKIGVAGSWRGWSIGLTLTTPSVSLFGSGESNLNRTVFGQEPIGNGDTEPVFVADYQDGLAASYRSPFSAAFGASKRFGATTLHASAEWFAKVGESVVLDPEPFVGQSTGDTVAATVTLQLDAVLNAGIGVEHRLGTATALYGGFRTDRSGRVPGSRVDIAATSWNIYFITVGARFRAAGADFTLGLGYGFGSDKGLPGAEGGLAAVLPDEMLVQYRNYRLIFAFAF